MANTHVALYDLTSGVVLVLWARSASDDAADLATNGFLTVDGVRVVEGVDATKLGAFAVDGPTADDVTAPPYTMEVDNVEAPTDVTFLAVAGQRDGFYFGDYEDDGFTLKEE